MSRSNQEIRQYIDSLEIIDSHEHLPYCEAAREKPTDVLRKYLLHYIFNDLILAGLSLDIAPSRDEYIVPSGDESDDQGSRHL